MKDSYRIYTRIGFLMAGTAVILGALGAHFLKDFLGEQDLSTFETGVRYQMFHALAIIFISLAHRKLNEKSMENALLLFTAGVLIFSGSLYLLATRKIWGSDSFLVIGAITPIGGISMILGWFILFFKGFDTEESDTLTSNSDSGRSHRKHRRHRRSSQEEKTEQVTGQ